jgi:tetratricopeptide (TPR) repeat protein
MFEEKDYIMKIIQQFTNAVARIMGLKAENKIEESQVVLTDTLKDFTGLNKEVLEALPYEIILQRVSGQTNSLKSLLLAELLNQQADIYEIKGELSRARNLYSKSLNITINVLLKGDNSVLEQNQDKVNGLIEKIGRLDVPRESLLLLFQYYELTKDYAKAEDVLFELIDKTEANKDLLAKGIAFYERLINKDQIDLQKGNLPIDEVLEGLANLKRI